MFRPIDKKRLLELAGMRPLDMVSPHSSMKPTNDKEDSDAGLHGEQPTGGDEPTEEHLDKETEVFQAMHDALDKLLSFLHSQEDFEEKRGKEPEYAKMEQDAQELKDCMKKHLAGYEPDEDEHGDVDKPDVMRMVK